MKKINYLVVIILLFINCKKNPLNDTTISGKWEWFKTTRFILADLTPQNTGYTWSLILNPDLTCIQSGDLHSGMMGIQNTVGTGIYTLEHVNLNPNGINLATGLVTISLPNWKYAYPFVKKSQDTLILDQQSATDGTAHFFVKK